MDIVYKKVNAQITPEALAKLKQKRSFLKVQINRNLKVGTR